MNGILGGGFITIHITTEQVGHVFLWRAPGAGRGGAECCALCRHGCLVCLPQFKSHLTGQASYL